MKNRKIFLLIEIILLYLILSFKLVINEDICEDIISKYVIYTQNIPINAMSIKFRSLILNDITIWFDDNTNEGVYQGYLKFGQETTITSYPGHVFFFKDAYDNTNQNNIISEIEITQNKTLYLITVEYDESFLSSGKKLSLKNHLENSQREIKFMEEYFEKTGRHWLHYFDRKTGKPRNPPILHMWPSLKIGSYHTIQSNELYWVCNEVNNILCRSTNPLLQNENNNNNKNSLFSRLWSYFNPSPPINKLTFRLISISNSPRALLIENFLSSFEADEIIRLALPNITQSVVGQNDGGGIIKSSTRTSSNTWIPRSTSPLIESIHRRVADILGVNHSILSTKYNSEDIQVVHYNINEEYQSHYDWGVRGYPESRFATVLLYLSDQIDNNSGGETYFPKGEEINHPGGFKIVPKKGSVVIFYNLLEDGNGDKDSLHAALPVLKGEKWLANFWVWDPIITESIRKR